MKFDGWYTCREYMDTSTGSIVWKYEKLNKVSNELEFLYFFNQQQTYLMPCYVKDDSVKEENPLVTSLPDQVKYVGYWDSAANVGRTYIDETAGTIQVASVLRWGLKKTLNDKSYTFKEAGIVRSYTDNEPTLEKYDNNIVRKQVSKLKNYTGTYQYTLKMAKKYLDKDIYIRGYIKYVDESTGEKVTVYTDVVHYDPMT